MGVTARPIVYDVTRLVTRALNPTPNGIDRIDFALAGHFLADPQNLALICTVVGPRLAPAPAAMRTIREIEAFWRERADPNEDEAYAAVVAALAGDATRPMRIERKPLAASFMQNWRALRDWAFRPGPRPDATPHGAIFFNASQFLVDKDWFLRWLTRRPDVRPVFYVHDLLAIDYPEFFWPKESGAQEQRMRNVCRRAAGVVTGSRAAADRFRELAASCGRGDLALCVARPRVSPVFEERSEPPPELAGVSYFVVCGTIEPRKNHLLLLNVWRELAAQGAAPKLVIVGKRGWLNDNVLRLLRNSRSLQAHVVEAEGLSTPALRRLLAGARALLAPSFDEGFGLPVAEAVAAGIPVIASDIPAFREIGGMLDCIDPADGLRWRDAIADYAKLDSPRRKAALKGLRQRGEGTGRNDFFPSIEAFLREIEPPTYSRIFR